MSTLNFLETPPQKKGCFVQSLARLVCAQVCPIVDLQPNGDCDGEGGNIAISGAVYWPNEVVRVCAGAAAVLLCAPCKYGN